MSKVKLLEERIKKLDDLSVAIDNGIKQAKADGYRDAPQYLLDLKKEVTDQKAVCEAEKKNFQEGMALYKEINKPGKTDKEIADGNARLIELTTELNDIRAKNESLHNTPTANGVADPCIPCLIKKGREQNPLKHYIKFKVLDNDSNHLKDVGFTVELPDGNTKEMVSRGSTLNVSNIEPGTCKIELKWYPGVTVYDALIIS